MIYLDSQNGDVLAYVGSKDYYDETIDGQVDIIQSQRQP
jgi:membrane carboxypeptidase/penicillin-binding protein PbpC